MSVFSSRPVFVAMALVSHAFVVSATVQGADYAVVVSDGTVLRSGDMPRFYRVLDLSAGTVVETLGEKDGWTQVVYPAGAKAYVEADRVEKKDANTLVLTQESNLLAPSALLGASGSWCPLFAEPLKPGTELRLVEEVAGIGGKVSKYLVEAPRPPAVAKKPRGFVQSDKLRAATAQEIEAFQQKQGAGGEASAQRPGQASGQPSGKAPVQTPSNGSAQQPGQGEQAGVPQPGNAEPSNGEGSTEEQGSQTAAAEVEGVDTALLEPMVSKPLPALQNMTLATDNGGSGQSEPTNHEEMVALTINQLNAAFDQLRSLPREKMDAGLEEMLAECRRSAGRLSSEPGLVEAINQRIAWLELRIKLRDQKRALDKTLAQADERRQALQKRVQEWQATRSFTLIGRVVPSTLYDGKRLPLMYRIESVEGPGSQRTVGYLRPKEGQDISKYVGAVVGIRGNTHFDDALNMRIVDADHIETLDKP